MTETIKGMSIDLGLDTIKVDTGLKDLKSKLSTVNSEMKKNMSAFDRGDKSIGKYETRLKGLNKKLEVQAQVTDKAKTHYEKMVKEHGEGSKEAEKAAREYNNQSAALNNLDRYVGNVTEELKEMRKQQKIANSGWTKTGKKLQATGDKMTKVGGGMQSFGKKWMKVTALAGGAVLGLGGSLFALTNKITANGDAIAKHSQQMGVSTEFYQEMDYWASQNGLSQEQMEKAVGRLNQRMGRAAQGNKKYSKALESLGINMDEVRAGTLSTEDAFAQSIQSLSEMDNEQEKAGLATELFGTRMARQLLPALQDGSLSMEDAKKKAQELGIVMSDDQLDAASKFQDTWDNVKRSMSLFGEGIAMDVLPYMQKMLDWTLTNMPKIKESVTTAFGKATDTIKNIVVWFNNLSKPTKKAIGLFAGIAVAIGPVSLAIGTLLKIFGPFIGIIGKGLAVVGKFGGILPIIKAGFIALTGPVGIIIGVITALTVGFITAYKKSDTFRGIVNKLKDAFLNVVSGIKEFLTTNPKILAFVDGVKSAFNTLKDKVSSVIKTIVEFFKSKITVMKSFWDNEGAQFLDAFSNVFGGIWKVVKPILDAVLAAVKVALPIIKGIFDLTFKAVLAVIKMVWGNIKGVIDGGLKIIMGLIKTFSGLFTGDFSKMWEGVKDIFAGAIKFVWNFVQLTFFGKLIKGVGVFVKGFSGFFSNMWTGIKNLFSTVIKWIADFVKNRFTAMQTTISTITNAVKTVISKIWNGILSFFKSVIKSIIDFVKTWFNNLVNNTTRQFNAVKDFISKVWNSILSFFKSVIKSIIDFVKRRFDVMKSNISNIFTGIKNIAKTAWNKIKSNIVDPVKSGVSWAIKKFTSFKDSVTTTFKNIKDNVFGYVSDMIQNVKDMPGKMKDGLIEMGGKVKEGVVSIANIMAEGLGKGVNGVIGGVNDVLEKLHVSKDNQLNKWPIPEYAQGTGSHPGGLAQVGDGKGNNAGSELIRTGNKYSLSPSKPTLVNLPKGAEVLPAKLTKQIIPQYGWGTDIWQGTKNAAGAVKNATVSAGKAVGHGVKKGAGAVKDFGINVWDYAKNPSKLLNLALKAIGVTMPSGATTLGKIAKGGFKTVKSNAVDFIKDKMDNMFDFGGGNVSGNVKSWISQAISATGSPGNWAGPLSTIAMKESGGRTGPSTINKWDSNWTRGTPSMGLMQTIGPTFNAHKKHGMNDIMNPVHNAVAAINYIKSRYGSAFNVPGIKSMAQGRPYVGYKDGTNFVPQDGFAFLHKGEAVVPEDYNRRRTDAMKLLALAGKEIQGNKRPGQLPNSGGNNGTDYTKELLNATLEQNEILMQLLAKDTDVYIGEKKQRELGKVTEPHVTAQQQRKNNPSRRGTPRFA